MTGGIVWGQQLALLNGQAGPTQTTSSVFGMLPVGTMLGTNGSQVGDPGNFFNFLYPPQAIPGLPPTASLVKGLCTGNEGASIMLLDDGSVWATGRNDGYSWQDPGRQALFSPRAAGGLLGTIVDPNPQSPPLSPSGTYDHPMPVQVPLGASIIDIAVNEDCAYALDVNGELWGWGNNRWGALGLGVVGVSPFEPQVIYLGGVRKVIAGGRMAAIQLTDGSVWTTGGSATGEMGRNLGETGFVNDAHIDPNWGQVDTSAIPGGVISDIFSIGSSILVYILPNGSVRMTGNAGNLGGPTLAANGVRNADDSFNVNYKSLPVDHLTGIVEVSWGTPGALGGTAYSFFRNAAGTIFVYGAADRVFDGAWEPVFGSGTGLDLYPGGPLNYFDYADYTNQTGNVATVALPAGITAAKLADFGCACIGSDGLLYTFGIADPGDGSHQQHPPVVTPYQFPVSLSGFTGCSNVLLNFSGVSLLSTAGTTKRRGRALGQIIG